LRSFMNRSTNLSVPQYTGCAIDEDCPNNVHSNRSSISSTGSSVLMRGGGLGASLLSFRSSVQSSIRTVRILLVEEATWSMIFILTKLNLAVQVAPFSKHRCCLGCVSLRDAIPLICVTQFILLAMASVIVLDIYISDGFLFYTRALEGRGRQVAQAFLFVVVVSFALHFLTILAWKHGRPRLYLLQAVWQLFLVGILVYILAQVAYAMHFSPPRILFASGCVISIFFSVVILLELWWAFVMVDAAFFEGFYYGRPSSRGDNDDDDCKADSRHIVLPVVTVDCVSE
ncbi:hypothetical protein PMAYCL1PPCAC_30966, partial [Pristionchus mayeri]